MADPWIGEGRLFWLFYLIWKATFLCQKMLTLRINRGKIKI